MNKQVLLKSRPTGKPAARNFEIAEAPSESTKEGELLVKAKYISVDPYIMKSCFPVKSIFFVNCVCIVSRILFGNNKLLNISVMNLRLFFYHKCFG